MRWSDDRILTTHVGSLPRGEPLTSLLLAEEKDGRAFRSDEERCGNGGRVPS